MKAFSSEKKGPKERACSMGEGTLTSTELICRICISFKRDMRYGNDRLKGYELHLRVDHGLTR